MRPKHAFFIRILVILTGCLVFGASALAAEKPWPGDKWRADVSEIRQGTILHTTFIGVETHTERGSRISVTCSFGTGSSRKVIHAKTFGLMRQDDFEGGTDNLGTFSIYFPGTNLKWLDKSPCAEGKIKWHRL